MMRKIYHSFRFIDKNIMVSRNKPQNLKGVYALSKVLPPSNFAVFVIDCKELKLAQTP